MEGRTPDSLAIRPTIGYSFIHIGNMLGVFQGKRSHTQQVTRKKVGVEWLEE